jgi:anti-sigma regulatory factor (Ser/Thr protein kinase)
VTLAPIVDRFRHEAFLYSGSAEFVEGAVPFIRGGLEAGEPVLVVESPDKIRILREALDADGREVMFADMADVGANPARIIPAWEQFVATHGSGGRRLRGIGEPIWKGRDDDELVECQRHESLLNVAFAHGQPWWLLCPYDTETLDDAVIAEARRSHEFVCHAGAAVLSGDFRGVEASGAPFEAPLPAPGSEVRGLDFGIGDIAKVRKLAARLATDAGLDVEQIANLVLAVHEVASNSIRHGGGRGTLRAWRGSDRIVCEISDRGRYASPLSDRRRPDSRNAPSGLWLANQLCHLVQIRSLADGTVVRLHTRVNGRHRLRLV